MKLKVPLTFGVSCKVNAYSFFIVWFITQSILDRITPNFQVWSLKSKRKIPRDVKREFFGSKGITSSIFFNGDISCTIGLSSNMLKENQIEDLHLYLNMICDIINLGFNKMEETFQSNTLDWSSLVLSYFSLPPSASLAFSLICQPISMRIWHVDSTWWDEEMLEISSQ